MRSSDWLPYLAVAGAGAAMVALARRSIERAIEV